MTTKYRYDQYTIAVHDVIRPTKGEPHFRGINACMNKEGHTWQEACRSEQAVSMAIGHELLRGVKDRQSAGEFNRVA